MEWSFFMFENSIQEYYLQQVRDFSEERRKRLSKIKTRAQAEAYVSDVRKKIAKIFALPEKKCPLNFKVCKEQQLNGITVKSVIYESREKYPVTALLMIPPGEGKHPASLFLCGHSNAGKAADTYWTAAMNLCKQGFVVLSIDPIAQGERLQIFNDKGDPVCCTTAHNLQGKLMQLSDEFLGSWRAWDAIRGLDLLLTLPEVDENRLAVTGNSGGGTMTTFVNALESRLCMAAPSCYITTWKREIENELPADIEQMPPCTWANGLEMADFIIAQAPRPTLIMGQKDDFFDPRGTREAFEEAKRIYSLLGKSDNIQLFIGPDAHGYHSANRHAMYDFFHKNAFGDDKCMKEDAGIVVPAYEDTYATPTGRVIDLPQYNDLQSFIVAAARKNKSKIKELPLDVMRKKLAAVLKIGKIELPYYRKLRPGRRFDEKYIMFSRFGLETEKNRVMSVLKCYYKDYHEHICDFDEVTLYVSHLDADQEIFSQGRMGTDEKLFGLDVRGIGELLPSSCDKWSRDFFAPYMYDYHYASLGIMFDRPVSGGKVRDILAAIALLKNNGVKKINLEAEGQGCIPALFAAVLSDDIAAVKLNNMPESYVVTAEKLITRWPLSAMPRGILKLTDLDILRKYVPDLTYSIIDEPKEKI